ncbi:hypothetical protein [Mesorhizobium sp.]|uniref:hypothetical protein n=1 Tax=Mesorhizobium sp. TaxID=1871066 RepID=UPI003BA92C34
MEPGHDKNDESVRDNPDRRQRPCGIASLAEDDEREKASNSNKRGDKCEPSGALTLNQPANEKCNAYQDDPDRIEYLCENDSGQKHGRALNFKTLGLSRSKGHKSADATQAFESRHYTFGQAAIPLEAAPWLDLTAIRPDVDCG